MLVPALSSRNDERALPHPFVMRSPDRDNHPPEMFPQTKPLRKVRAAQVFRVTPHDVERRYRSGIGTARQRTRNVRGFTMSVTRTTSAKGWAVCLVAIFGGISLALVQNKVSPIITVLMDVFGISMGTAGLLSTIFTFVGIIMALPAAMIIKRFGPKKAGVAALAFAIVGSLIGLATDNVGVLIVSRVVEGTGIGIIAVLAPTLISMWFPPEKRGLPMGLWGSWMMVSQTILFFCAAPLSGAFGWQGMWMLGLVACVLTAVLFLVFVESPAPGESFADVESSEVSIREGLKSRASFTLAIAAACFTFCSFTFVSWVSAYWGVATSWSLEEIGRWVAILYLVEMVYAWIIGGILNRVKNRKRLGVVSFFAYGLIGLAAFLITGEPLVVAFVFVFPIFDALIPCICWTIGPETASKPMYAGIALGVLNIGLNTGTLLSAPVSGALVESFGWVAAGACFLIVALVGAAAMAATKLSSAAPSSETPDDAPACAAGAANPS